MTTLEVLKAAREHLSDPARWYKGGPFDRAWDAVPMQRPCCAMGAVNLFSHNSGALKALRCELPKVNSGIAAYNDDPTTTHADILALFDRAIAAEEARQ